MCELVIVLFGVDIDDFLWWVSLVDVVGFVLFLLFFGVDCSIVLIDGVGFCMILDGM